MTYPTPMEELKSLIEQAFKYNDTLTTPSLLRIKEALEKTEKMQEKLSSARLSWMQDE